MEITIPRHDILTYISTKIAFTVISLYYGLLACDAPWLQLDLYARYSFPMNSCFFQAHHSA